MPLGGRSLVSSGFQVAQHLGLSHWVLRGHYLDGFHHQVVVDAAHGSVGGKVLLFDSEESLGVELLAVAKYVILGLSLAKGPLGF